MSSGVEREESPNRREFCKTSTATMVAGALAGAWPLVQNVHAAGSDVIRVGLIGCGGRGTGAATQALNADKQVKLVAMGDAFEDRLQRSLVQLKRDKEITAKIDVAPDHCFVGFDAYKQVIDCGVDVVLLTTPPHFRPIHMRYALEQGKHVFAEKPCAVDAPGVRSVLASAELARTKGLSLVAGLQTRYSNQQQEMIKRIHDGAIGEIAVLQANDFRGPIWVRPREQGWSDMTWHMRNWYYFTWLSGDFNVEQHVHMLDLCTWAMKDEYPKQAIGTGGRQVRTGPEYGHIYDHFSIIYEYASGAKLFASCCQQKGCRPDISAHFIGTKGRATRGRITTPSGELKFDRDRIEPVQAEHDALFASIRNGKPINNGEYLAKSSLLTIMGRMAGYTGQVITWDMAMNSKEDLSPPRYAWDVELAVPPVAMPGVTRYA